MPKLNFSKIIESATILFYFIYFRYGMRFRSRAELEHWQERKVMQFLTWMLPRSKFYRAQADGLALKEWRRFPLVDKKIMMENFDQLNTAGLIRDQAVDLAVQAEQSRDFSPMIGDTTVGLSSGTSGYRGLFVANQSERALYAGAILAKALPRVGRRERVAFFLRANSNLYESVGGFFLRFKFFDLLRDVSEHVNMLNIYQPTLLVGPPSLLRKLAEAKLRGELKIAGVGRIYSAAEVLDPIDEQYLELAFRQKIHQIYQCTEGFLAISCREGHLHLNEDIAVIQKEDLGDGRFVPIITDFRRRTQPIIRYRLNDILSEEPKPCACGSPFRRIKMIEGRSDDMIYLPRRGKIGYRAVFPDFIRNGILYAGAPIDEYMVEQQANGNLTVRLRSADFVSSREGVREQLQLLCRKMDCDLPYIEFDDHFPDLKLNKLRRVRSDFRPPEQNV